jgi:murein DD-endopeptidase MepM/ murein hydrolase activator NlpD
MKRIVYPLIACLVLVLGLTLLSYDVLSPFAEEEPLVDYKAVDFIKPIDLPFKLSGNFGEIRTNHFHSGLDIKTNGEIGYPVYSIGDGYVSRIKISSYGYGKAIYITHPNGFTSVYAHLNEITGEAGKYLRSQQYNRKNFSVDLYPSKDMIKIRQGQVVAKSGNSGGSGGPHLHFEIRETASSKPINPLKFNYALPDSISPLIESVSFYAINDNSGIIASNTFKAAKKTNASCKEGKWGL